MSRKDKLIKKILRNPSNVRFNDACLVAEWLQFEKKAGKGSHTVYVHPSGIMLNFQNRKGFILAYQGDQLAKAIKKYWRK